MTNNREHWGSRLGFILAAAGSAIGLGTMWKLPYTMGQNGGGAFILLFLLFNCLVGIPLFMGELLLGRKSQRGAVGAFHHFTGENSSWPMVGWLSVAASFLIVGWYCVVAGWGLNYVIMALADAFKGHTPEQTSQVFDIFRQSGDLNVLWQVVFIAMNAAIVGGGLSKGIEYWSKIMTSGLFVALIALVIYSATLPGFGQAVQYILYPDFSALTGASVLKALGLALFTLSLGYGVMVTYGSYMQPTDDIPKTSIIVGIANFITSILIALMIYPMIFTFGFKPQSGEGLIFKTLPYVFEQLPGSVVVSVMFFTLLIFAALTSSVSMLEVGVANFMDLKGWPRKKAVAVSTGICLVLGLPTALAGSDIVFVNWQKIFGTSFLETNIIINDWMLAIVALFTSLFVGWGLNDKVRRDGFSHGSTMGYLYRPWLLLMRYIVPLAILLVIVHHADVIDLDAIFDTSGAIR